MSLIRPDPPWWQSAVVYLLYPWSFQDSNGDGIGDLPGIISRLDYLKGTADSLGIDAIWLSPIHPSPMHDFGYDVMDYCNIDPRFGTLADFDRLTSEAHRRGIRLLIAYSDPIRPLILTQVGHFFEPPRNRWPTSRGIRSGEPPPVPFGAVRDTGPRSPSVWCLLHFSCGGGTDASGASDHAEDQTHSPTQMGLWAQSPASRGQLWGGAEHGGGDALSCDRGRAVVALTGGSG